MNFIKKFFRKRKLKKKLKLAIESICTFHENFSIDKTHFMCTSLYKHDIDRNKLPNFNRESFSLFIKEHYPYLVLYLTESDKASWMDYNNGYYPDEQITEAKKAFLTYIMNNL